MPYSVKDLAELMYDESGFSASMFFFAKWSNLYQSNRQLSDEIRYVFDRKKLESQLGNSLDRPSLLMKRNYVRETQMGEEMLGGGTLFSQAAEIQQKEADQYDYRRGGRRGGGGGGGGGPGERHRRIRARTGREAEDLNIEHRGSEITEVQNFVKNPPLQKYNIKPVQVNEETETATFEVEVKLSQFEHLRIVIVDKDSVTQRLVSIDKNTFATRDLRLNKKLDPAKGLTETRRNKTLIPEDKKDYDQKDFIEDITSSEITIVDDMVKVNEILDEVMKLSRCSGSQDYKKFYTFIGKWANGLLSREEKNKYYTEYLCHELNLFLKKRDPEFFEAVVKPFLACKMEKRFVDYYLLGDYLEAIKYAEFHLNGNLNAME